MTGPMRAISDVIPTTVPAITDPWLGTLAFSSQLAALAAWGIAAFAATVWLARRTTA